MRSLRGSQSYHEVALAGACREDQEEKALMINATVRSIPQALQRVHCFSVRWLVAIQLIASVVSIQAATYYVSLSGADGNPGTAASPWRTIQKAASSAQAGDTVIVTTGDYNERVSLPGERSGSPQAPIIFKAEPRRTVSMRGFVGDRNAYVRIQGFNITHNAGLWMGGGIWLDGNNWEIVDNYFYDIPGAAIQPTWQTGRITDNIYVAHNRIYKCNKGFVVGGNNWIVENNEVERLVYYNEDADYLRFFGRNHVIRNNYFHGTLPNEIGSSHVDGFQSFNNSGNVAQDVIIEANLVYGFFHQGIMLEGADGSHSNITIRNNVFADSASWGIAAHGVTGLKIYNNVFANIASSGIGFRKAKSGSGNPTAGEILNNIFYNVKSDYWSEEPSQMEARNNLLYHTSLTKDPSKFPNDIVNQDPMLLDPELYRFELRANSPAIDAGVALAGFAYDIQGTVRPQGGAWDIGAYEYVGVVSTPSAPRNLRIGSQ